MPPPTVNQRRDLPLEQPIISLLLLVQVGSSPGAPGAGPPGAAMTDSAAAGTSAAGAAIGVERVSSGTLGPLCGFCRYAVAERANS
jgi:hypothetical protein